MNELITGDFLNILHKDSFPDVAQKCMHIFKKATSNNQDNISLSHKYDMYHLRQVCKAFLNTSN